MRVSGGSRCSVLAVAVVVVVVVLVVVYVDEKIMNA